jgi:murein DD-endopeptidase MepM/ murein hydrolase activator NlpD
MRHYGTLLLASLLLFSSACSSERPAENESLQQSRSDQVAEGVTSATAPQQKPMGGTTVTESAKISTATNNDSEFSAQNEKYEAQKISFDANAPNAPVTVIPERKVIRDAELTIEIESPSDAQRKLASVAEAHGGFVVTSESRQDTRAGGVKSSQVVSLEMRVPAAQFDAVINAAHGVGGRVADEKIAGKDVTEEYIDLEARLRAQRALEAQILEIMKRAQRVSDALEVNAQLAQVRSEIERLEGRRRFLENQSSLSTIKITLQPPAPLVSAETTGFATNIRRAFGDGVDFAAALAVGMVRVVVTLLPVALLLCLPAWATWRVLRRRCQRTKPVAEWQPTPPPTGA